MAATTRRSPASAAASDGRIAVYVRVRPHARAAAGLVDVSADRRRIAFSRSGGGGSGSSDDARGPGFSFTHVFVPGDDQDEVFDRAAVPSVLSALDGYNATVFAYGQTGSGKCLSPSTLLLRADGAATEAARVDSGDLLVGDDGSARVALSAVRGVAPLFRVRSADDLRRFYVCNDAHLIVLEDSRGRSRTAAASKLFRECGGGGGVGSVAAFVAVSGGMRGVRRGVEAFPLEFSLQRLLGELGENACNACVLAQALGAWIASGKRCSAEGTTFSEQLLCKVAASCGEDRFGVPGKLFGAACDVRKHLLSGMLGVAPGNLDNRPETAGAAIRFEAELASEDLAQGAAVIAQSLGLVAAMEERSPTKVVVSHGDLHYNVEIGLEQERGEYCGFTLGMFANSDAFKRYAAISGHAQRVHALREMIARGEVIPSNPAGLPAADGRFPGRFLLADFTVTHNTWTITGGTKKYTARGIIPRALSMVFQEMRNRSSMTWSAHVSYMEIYNEVAYDLLDPTHEGDTIEELPRVHIRTDEDGEIHFINLRQHLVTSEEQALNLMFLGDTNRTIAETPMNPASSRSHCIFTVFLEARTDGVKKVRRSKLHFVDLAGSERASKTGSRGDRFRESTYINKGLHFLEQVIVTLQQRKGHVPYRNSKITHVLRDSLGGNARTSMIATITPTDEALSESIATCKFATRVACVSNRAVVNERLDPRVEVVMLRKEIDILRMQLQQRGPTSVASGEVATEEAEDRTPLSSEQLAELVAAFLEDNSPDSFLHVGNAANVQDCFQLLKQAYRAARQQLRAPASEDAQKMIKDLRARVAQRDREVSVLVSMLKKSSSSPLVFPSSSSASSSASVHSQFGRLSPVVSMQAHQTSQSAAPSPTPLQSVAGGPARKSSGSLLLQVPGGAGTVPTPQRTPAPPPDEETAWEEFRAHHADREALEENTTMLQKLRDEAKALGELAAKTREHANLARARLEKRRIDRALRNAMAPSSAGTTDDLSKPDAEEERLRAEVEHGKEAYKQQVAKLNDVRRRVVTLETLVKRVLESMRSDFETMYNVMYVRDGAGSALSSTTPGGPRTPSVHSSSSPPAAPRQAWSGTAAAAAAGAPPSPSPAAVSTPSRFSPQPPMPTGVEEADEEIQRFYNLLQSKRQISPKGTR